MCLVCRLLSANIVLLCLFSHTCLFLYLFYVDVISHRTASWSRFPTWEVKEVTTPFLLTIPSLPHVQVASMLIQIG